MVALCVFMSSVYRPSAVRCFKLRQVVPLHMLHLVHEKLKLPWTLLAADSVTDGSDSAVKEGEGAAEGTEAEAEGGEEGKEKAKEEEKASPKPKKKKKKKTIKVTKTKIVTDRKKAKLEVVPSFRVRQKYGDKNVLNVRCWNCHNPLMTALCFVSHAERKREQT